MYQWRVGFCAFVLVLELLHYPTSKSIIWSTWVVQVKNYLQCYQNKTKQKQKQQCYNMRENQAQHAHQKPMWSVRYKDDIFCKPQLIDLGIMETRKIKGRYRRRNRINQWINQSSSKIWKVLTRMVSMTRTCQPASAMAPAELAPIRVGLSCTIVSIKRCSFPVVGILTYPKQMAMFPAFIRFSV